MCHLRTQFSGGLGSAELTLRFDLADLFQPEQVYNSVILLDDVKPLPPFFSFILYKITASQKRVGLSKTSVC